MPPILAIPYPQAPAYCFPIAELSLYVLFVACLIHAVRQGSRHIGYLFGGLLFGILEYVNVNANLGYTYGKFWIMFGRAPKDIPLCIGVGWGIIMYASRLFSDRLGLALWSAAALDALLAISIDLSMDTVAYRLHMWHWDWSDKGLDPLTAQWFGVPWGNFFGWLMVVFFYASFSRLLERALLNRKLAPGAEAALSPLLAVLLSQICLYVMLVHVGPFLHDQFGITSLHRFVVFIVILAGITAWGLRRKKAIRADMPFLAWFVPVWFHCFFFAWLFIGGFYQENAWMLVTSTINIVLGVSVHLIAMPKRGVIKPAMQGA